MIQQVTFLQQIAFGWPVDFMLGMCFPQSCTINELNSLILKTLTENTETGVSANGVSDRRFITSGTWLVDQCR